MTLIQGFRLEDIVLQIEMNTQLRERVNRNTVNLPQCSCATFVTQMMKVSPSLFLFLSLCLSFSLPLFTSIYVSWLLTGSCLLYMPSSHLHSNSSSLLWEKSLWSKESCKSQPSGPAGPIVLRPRLQGSPLRLTEEMWRSGTPGAALKKRRRGMLLEWLEHLGFWTCAVLRDG